MLTSCGLHDRDVETIKRCIGGSPGRCCVVFVTHVSICVVTISVRPSSSSPTSIIATHAVMHNHKKPGNPCRRSVRLRTIASKDHETTPTSFSRHGSACLAATMLPKGRPPLRSRDGCSACQRRRVKCGKIKPMCTSPERVPSSSTDRL